MDFLKRLKGVLQGHGDRIKNRNFLEASMATAALVATADGIVTFSERIAVDQVLENVDALKLFDPHEAVNRFNHFVDAIEADPDAGQEEALGAIQSCSTDSDSATLMVKIGCAISRADGNFSNAEKIQVQAIAESLGIDTPDLTS